MNPAQTLSVDSWIASICFQKSLKMKLKKKKIRKDEALKQIHERQV